jgi:hypothetical protein
MTSWNHGYWIQSIVSGYFGISFLLGILEVVLPLDEEDEAGP